MDYVENVAVFDYSNAFAEEANSYFEITIVLHNNPLADITLI